MLMTIIGAAAAATSLPNAAPMPTIEAQVLELRQYKIVDGRRDAFIEFFEDRLIEGQEAVSMRLIGQFKDHDDPRRFVWLRAFADMASRERALTEFYFGPVWAAERGGANPMLEDNDNVLLLRPAAADLALAPSPRQQTDTPSAVWAIIQYLWKAPEEGFADLFRSEMKPLLEAGGIDVVGAYVPLDEPNNFPRLPVRAETKLFVWFVRGTSHEMIEKSLRNVRSSGPWQTAVSGPLELANERPAQILRLDPTPRSALR